MMMIMMMMMMCLDSLAHLINSQWSLVTVSGGPTAGHYCCIYLPELDLGMDGPDGRPH